MTIQLVGDSEIENVSTGIYVYARSDSTGKATLNITGSGSLDASGSSNGILVQSNSGDATLTIQNADVTAENSSYSGDGVTVRAGSSSSASLSVDGGSLTATGTGVGSGINFQFGNGDSGTGTPAVTVSGNAIVRANGGISDNSSKDIQIGDGDDSSGGIVFDGDEGTVYGSVELQENLTIGEGESLTLANGASLNANNHNVIVDGGTLDSTLATSLGDSVKYTPTITTTSPLSNGTVGTYYSQTLTATGTGDITWSLAEDSSLPAGLSLNASTGAISGTPSAAGTYKFTVTAANAYGSDSRELSITINPATLSITTQPSSQSVTEGNPAAFSVTATGSGTLNYQWQQSTNNGSTWTDISGATSATYTIENTTTGMNGYQYRCAVTGNGSSVTSNAATLTVTPKQYTLTVVLNGGSGTTTSGKYAEGAVVQIDAGTRSNYRFTGWTSSNGGTFADASSASTTFTMPAADTTITANWAYSGGGGPTTYAITAPDAENGTVRVSPSRASRGTTVTITVTPDAGYELESLTALDSRGNEIALTDQGDGKYTFTMPADRVTVEASFAEIAPAPLPFADVSDGDWFAGAVRFVYESGMMNGVSETAFAPHGAASRSMIVTILWRLEGEPVVDYAMDFTDVDGDAYYAAAVRWAASVGIVNGTGDATYRPDAPVTREQLAAILYRYAVYKGYDVSIGEDADLLRYADAAELSAYAIPAMQWACGAGIVNGTSASTLSPQGGATRAQVAAMLMRLCTWNTGAL